MVDGRSVSVRAVSLTVLAVSKRPDWDEFPFLWPSFSNTAYLQAVKVLTTARMGQKWVGKLEAERKLILGNCPKEG